MKMSSAVRTTASAVTFDALPPLSLYVHLPWCVRKCPYCDFNSHALRAVVPEKRYVDALLNDLAVDASLLTSAREIETIFIGGGTPSLFHPEAIARLLAGTRERVAVKRDVEVTLEANPGTVELDRFRGFREAGVNRLSIGIQSFDDRSLRTLGRIHGREEALAAGVAARVAGFDNFNLDLMYGLPGQDVGQTIADVEAAIDLDPTHVSVYQLTLEPNTLFYREPPPLPDEQTIDAMHDAIAKRLTDRGYSPYEVSAYSRPDRRCRHNRNYWEFGDYLGIGAGAHGKISRRDGVRRIAKTRHPEAYLCNAGGADARAEMRELTGADLICEFMLNALRLYDGFPLELFTSRTGLSLKDIDAPMRGARERGLLEDGKDSTVRPSPLGRRFLNDLIMLFLPADRAPADTHPGLRRGD
jgi:putative oxygen-independent coproporphyrinogen III oxidase